MNPKIWRRDTDNKLFHDACFEDGEGKDGFTEVKSLDELSEDDECGSCEGIFLFGVTWSGVGADEESEDEEEDC